MARPRKRRARPKGWRHDASNNVWTHDATGLRFSGHMVAHYGWEAMPPLCVEIMSWRKFIAALPDANLNDIRDNILAEAMACDDDATMRAVAVRWTLLRQEFDATSTGGNTNGG